VFTMSTPREAAATKISCSKIPSLRYGWKACSTVSYGSTMRLPFLCLLSWPLAMAVGTEKDPLQDAFGNGS
jgi:hypothetical protein